MKRKKILINLLYGFIAVILSVVLFASLVFIYFARDLPRPERFMDSPTAEPTHIYDRSGNHLLYTIHGEERRDVIEISDIPPHFIDAILTAEDSNFYNHYGVDFQGIVRSAIANFQRGRTVAGGSTISQQFVRSAFLSAERTYMRKIREIILTLELERRYSKDQILEFYLNQIPFGHNAYGIEAAAQTYFNKPAKELSLNESAVLVTLVPSPSYLSPFGENVETLILRKDHLLNRMYQNDLITEEELEEAKEEDLEFSSFSIYLRAPHFVMEVKSQLEKKYGEEFLKENGLQVYTTIDFEMQQKAEKIIKEKAVNNYQHNAYNSALVAIEPNTGEILAMVGSVDYSSEPFPEGCIPGSTCKFDPYSNVAMRERQPGSSFKPFVYATAFQNGYSGDTIVIDERTNFGTVSNPYIPRNYDGQFRGEVTLRQSLAQSLNIPSVKALRDLAGLERSVENARLFGIELPRDASFYGLPLVLGGGDVKLLEITSAYGVFASGGYRNSPIFIKKITDKHGNIIEKNEPTLRRVLSSSIAEEITDILSDNSARAPVFGQNSLLHFPDHDIAVKTGSTQNFRDGWTIGYNSSLVVGVWTGNNNNASMINAPGIVVTAPIWREFFESFL